VDLTWDPLQEHATEDVDADKGKKTRWLLVVLVSVLTGVKGCASAQQSVSGATRRLSDMRYTCGGPTKRSTQKRGGGEEEEAVRVTM